MKNSYITLFKKIYETKELSLEPLGIKFKNFSTDVLATILYPLLNLKKEDEINNYEITTLDTKRLEYVYKVYNHYKNNRLTRIFIVSENSFEIYEEFRKEKLIIEDKYSETIFKNIDEFSPSSEIFFTSKNYDSFFRRISKKHNALILSFDFKKVHYYSNVLRSDLVDESIHCLIREQKFMQMPFIFHLLINSIGLTHLELQFIAALFYVEEPYIKNIINNCNTKFVNTYINALLKEKYHKEKDKKKSIFYQINNLLKNYRFELLKDVSYEKAIKVYA